MGWITIYIKGKSGFEPEVLSTLNSSGFPFMPGSSYEQGMMLYWIPEQKALRAFKKAIGSKIVFKYRLRFFTDVEEFVEFKHNEAENPELREEEV